MCRKVSKGSKDLAAVQTPSSPGAEPGTCQAWGWVRWALHLCGAGFPLPLPERLCGSTCASNCFYCALRCWKHSADSDLAALLL